MSKCYLFDRNMSTMLYCDIVYYLYCLKCHPTFYQSIEYSLLFKF